VDLMKNGENAIGRLGHIVSVSDLPTDRTLIACIQEAVHLNEEGVKAPARRPPGNKELVMPADVLASLKKNKQTRTTFENFSHSHKKECLQWIVEAKREETRQKRLAQMIA
jgi:uncharacterized protein YdeI (YjbR/CyaY-like superfamily)